VIGETLRRATPVLDMGDAAVRGALTERVRSLAEPPAEPAAFLRDPLSSWIEEAFGLETSPETEQLVRRPPRRLTGRDGAAGELATLTGLDEAGCAAAIQRQLLGGSRVIDPVTGRPAFAFRLHQFVTKDDMCRDPLRLEHG
jgi:hypothetical protein